jgi:hypothetical protein
VIAQALHDFLKGSLTHSVFADHAFDLQHNGGCVFGKHNMLSTGYGSSRSDVTDMLDAKKRATTMEELFRGLTKVSRDMSAKVTALLHKGERLGRWRVAPAYPGSHRGGSYGLDDHYKPNQPHQYNNAFWHGTKVAESYGA